MCGCGAGPGEEEASQEECRSCVEEWYSSPDCGHSSHSAVRVFGDFPDFGGILIPFEVNCRR